MRKNKVDNKGFSLVELIIVIAIIAILSAALAPQVMKYVNKSRKSVDDQNCKTLENIVNAAVASEKVWNDMCLWRNGQQFRFYIRMSDDGSKLLIDGLKDNYNSSNEIRSLINKLENPKQSGKYSYEVIIKSEKKVENGNEVYALKGVYVSTSDKIFNANADTNYNY